MRKGPIKKYIIHQEWNDLDEREVGVISEDGWSWIEWMKKEEINRLPKNKVTYCDRYSLRGK